MFPTACNIFFPGISPRQLCCRRCDSWTVFCKLYHINPWKKTAHSFCCFNFYFWCLTRCISIMYLPYCCIRNAVVIITNRNRSACHSIINKLISVHIPGIDTLTSFYNFWSITWKNFIRSAVCMCACRNKKMCFFTIFFIS